MGWVREQLGGRVGMNRIKINSMKFSKNKIFKKKENRTWKPLQTLNSTPKSVSVTPYSYPSHHGSTLSVCCFLCCYSGRAHVLTPMTHTHELNWKQSLCNVTGKESQNEVTVGDLSALNPLTEGQGQSAGTDPGVLCALGGALYQLSYITIPCSGFCLVSCVWCMHMCRGDLHICVHTQRSTKGCWLSHHFLPYSLEAQSLTEPGARLIPPILHTP